MGRHGDGEDGRSSGGQSRVLFDGESCADYGRGVVRGSNNGSRQGTREAASWMCDYFIEEEKRKGRCRGKRRRGRGVKG